MNDRPKRNTPAGEAPQEANFWTLCPEVTSGQLVPKLWGACQRRNTPQEWGRKPFRRERQRKAKWRKHMRENPYKRLPPIERKQDGSLYRMTPAQRKQANALIRRECCCYEDGNCMPLDDGTPAPVRRRFLSRSAVSGSAGRSCRWTGRWKRRFSGIRT